MNVVPQKQKVLRLGITKGGAVVNEFFVEHGEDVILGSGHLAEPGHDIPRYKGFKLFQYDAEGACYRLNALRDMGGRVMMETGPRDLADLFRGSHSPLELRLKAEDRGKVVIDDLTILFQFVDANIAARQKPSALAVTVRTTTLPLPEMLKLATVCTQIALDVAQFERVKQVALANYRVGDRYATPILDAIESTERQLKMRMTKMEKRIDKLTDDDKRALETFVESMSEGLSALDSRLADPNADPAKMQSIIRKLEREIAVLTSEVTALKNPAAIASLSSSN